MDPAEERLRADLVRRAIVQLRRGAVCTRGTLFEGAPAGTRDFQRKILNRLIIQKAVKKVEVNGSTTPSYQALNISLLTEIVESDESLALFIWPPPTLELEQPQPVEKETAPEPQEQVPFPPVTATEAMDRSPELVEALRENSKLLSDIVDLMNAAFQSLIYTRDKVDKLEGQVTELRTILEAYK